MNMNTMTKIQKSSMFTSPINWILLLANGAIIDQANEEGWTPLITASCFGHLEIVNVLLKHNANVHSKRKDGSTALDVAKIGENKMIVKSLLKADSGLHKAELLSINEDGDTQLNSAAFNNRLEEVEKLLGDAKKLGILKDLIDKADNNGWTPLNAAAQKAHLEIVEVLLL